MRVREQEERVVATDKQLGQALDDLRSATISSRGEDEHLSEHGRHDDQRTQERIPQVLDLAHTDNPDTDVRHDHPGDHREERRWWMVADAQNRPLRV